MNRTEFWEEVYATKAHNKVGWYQKTPKLSLHFIEALNLSHSDAIIDIGGGDSLLVDHLMELGYQDLSVLDISRNALERAKNRLNEFSNEIQWVHSDIVEFKPSQKFKLWHDRAAFHFLTTAKDQDSYIECCSESLEKGFYLIIGTFSKSGPQKCSGIPIVQYDIEDLKVKFSKKFKYIDGINVDHETPSGFKQNFSFCCFQKTN